jgi:putative transcriptional regulator
MSLGVSLKTVEAWESGKNVPSGPALRMIEMLKDDPDVLLKYNIIASA